MMPLHVASREEEINPDALGQSTDLMCNDRLFSYNQVIFMLFTRPLVKVALFLKRNY